MPVCYWICLAVYFQHFAFKTNDLNLRIFLIGPTFYTQIIFQPCLTTFQQF